MQEIRNLYEQGVIEAKGNNQVGVPLPRAELESARGFLIYISLTYTAMVPYLKGLHLMIDGWRPQRDQDGWKEVGRCYETVIEGSNREKAPDKMKAVMRSPGDLQALDELTEAPHPPQIIARPSATACAAFGFGDASGAGFGQSLWLMGEEDIDVFYGLWAADVSKG